MEPEHAHAGAGTEGRQGEPVEGGLKRHSRGATHPLTHPRLAVFLPSGPHLQEVEELALQIGLLLGWAVVDFDQLVEVPARACTADYSPGAASE